jgi:hypothetical protein
MPIPSNVSPLMHGAEMRIAETRAVNRALRKAYGIGICSVEDVNANIDPRCSFQSKKPAVYIRCGGATAKKCFSGPLIMT